MARKYRQTSMRKGGARLVALFPSGPAGQSYAVSELASFAEFSAWLRGGSIADGHPPTTSLEKVMSDVRPRTQDPNDLLGKYGRGRLSTRTEGVPVYHAVGTEWPEENCVPMPSVLIRAGQEKWLDHWIREIPGAKERLPSQGLLPDAFLYSSLGSVPVLLRHGVRMSMADLDSLWLSICVRETKVSAKAWSLALRSIARNCPDLDVWSGGWSDRVPEMYPFRTFGENAAGILPDRDTNFKWALWQCPARMLHMISLFPPSGDVLGQVKHLQPSLLVDLLAMPWRVSEYSYGAYGRCAVWSPIQSLDQVLSLDGETPEVALYRRLVSLGAPELQLPDLLAAMHMGSSILGEEPLRLTSMDRLIRERMSVADPQEARAFLSALDNLGLRGDPLALLDPSGRLRGGNEFPDGVASRMVSEWVGQVSGLALGRSVSGQSPAGAAGERPALTRLSGSDGGVRLR